MRLFLHTGEVSGDLHGALLIQALQRQAAERGLTLEITAVGGTRMAAAGAQLICNTLSMGAVGIFETLPYYIRGARLQRQINRYLVDHPPDLVILIDYMGPNIAVGRFIRRRLPQVPMAYYIAPQQWVWATQKGTRQILEVADKLLAIFPEEARYYRQQGGNVTWVGHPLVDAPLPARQAARAQLGLSESETVVTLLPASRQQELTYLLPVIFTAAQKIQDRLPAVKFLVPLSLPDFRDRIAQAIAEYGLTADLVETQQRAAIAAADLAIGKSGTANLEIALMDVPQVAMYRLSPLTAWLAEHVLKFSAAFISPVNLVEMQPIVPEFLQWEATPAAIYEAAIALLLDSEKRAEMRQGYARMRQALGEVGVCDRAAREILDMLYTRSLSQSH
ncbi:lipid-A-disaccharide synthase [Romeria aff. gracilis LEGE 07310]|uniref:Lipid-A-disaccharide synthase n=1 Tax=Vasconcelosia minhoensis LEGE 07310 TaxID=915328 RepID=A0A8J7AKE0_9CYAN|nr:lipid-A-disaccharide synthase [Romeria aff. gracilis LEGE 07310]